MINWSQMVKDYTFSMYPKFSETLTFLTLIHTGGFTKWHENVWTSSSSSTKIFWEPPYVVPNSMYESLFNPFQASVLFHTPWTGQKTKISLKTNVFYLLIHKRTCADQGVRNNSFSGNFSFLTCSGWIK